MFLNRIYLISGIFLALLFSLSQAEEMHIAFCGDNNFAECTGVAAYSLLKNMDPRDKITVHVVMTETLHKWHRKKFRQLEQMFFPRASIVVYDTDDTIQQILQALNGINGKHWGISASARLTLDKILPKNLNKVIYLDGDILAFSSLKALWHKLPCSPYAVAGVKDGYCETPHLCSKEMQKNKIQGIQVQNPGSLFSFYINSGILVFDLNRIRQENLFSKTIAWAIEHKPIFPDQDAINSVFHDQILELEGKWNTFGNHSMQHPIPDAAIVHFVGQPKPWNQRPCEVIKQRPSTLINYLFLQRPTSSIWHRYRQESPWKHSKCYSKWSLFLEFFQTKNDRKIFIPIFAVIITTLTSAIFVSFRLFSKKRKLNSH
jgi:lipopolysaccharide biosynthesis glycosyltransferase